MWYSVIVVFVNDWCILINIHFKWLPISINLSDLIFKNLGTYTIMIDNIFMCINFTFFYFKPLLNLTNNFENIENISSLL